MGSLFFLFELQLNIEKFPGGISGKTFVSHVRLTPTWNI